MKGDYQALHFAARVNRMSFGKFDSIISARMKIDRTKDHARRIAFPLDIAEFPGGAFLNPVAQS